MKQNLKAVFWIHILIANVFYGVGQSIRIHAGKTPIPTDYVSLRYSHYSNSAANICFGLFLDKTKLPGLDYTAFGVDLIGQVDTGIGESSNHLFECKIGLGATIQSEYEPWIIRKKMNYGLVAELAGEWMMTEIFGLGLFGQQKYFFNKGLGRTQFVFGLGISYHFSN